MKSKYPILVWLFCVTCLVLHFTIPVDLKFQLLTSPKDLVFNFHPINLSKAVLAGFLHVNFNHLFANMVLLIFMGYFVEKKIGHWNTFKLGLFGGIGALLLHVGANPSSVKPFLGASGYLFAFLTAYVFLI